MKTDWVALVGTLLFFIFVATFMWLALARQNDYWPFV
jgi:hypothetical protein